MRHPKPTPIHCFAPIRALLLALALLGSGLAQAEERGTTPAGYGVFGRSTGVAAVRGEAGDITGIPPPLWNLPIGVVGIGSNRGTYGSSGTGIGVWGRSVSNYGVWGESAELRGVTGRTGLANHNWGLYTPDNVFALHYQLLGSTLQVMRNRGEQALAAGDVVVFSGIGPALEADGPPMVEVARATQANSTAVAGVVYSRFDIRAIDPALEPAEGDMPVNVDSTPPGPVGPDEHLLVVIRGPARVNAEGVGRSIAVGDLLTSSDRHGQAMKAIALVAHGRETALPGTVLGKALQPLASGSGAIHVFVTLQ